jgi:Tfp pilus assembly protein PilF
MPMLVKKIALVVFLVAACVAHATPHIPASGTEIVEHLPNRNDPAQREFQRLRTELAAKPGDMEISAQLARRYINMARTEGDPRYLGYAQAALAPWWYMAQPPIKILVLRATILQSTHQFPAALVDLNNVLRADHNNAQAWLTRATVLQVQGQYMLAKNSCEHLYSLAPELITTTCLTNVGSLNGEAGQSYTQLSDAFRKTTNVDAGIQIWILTLLAEMSARRGDAATADRTYRQAMSLATPDSYLLGSYSDFLLDQKRPAEVAALLKNKKRVDALLLRYALALQALHDPAAAEQIDALAQRFSAAMMRADTVHQREHSRFELQLHNNPKEALRIAQLNWAVQKEPADVRVYLEAAAAANDRNAAAPVLLWLKQNRLEDVALTPLITKLNGNT